MALVRFTARVDADVDVAISRLAERLGAVRALVWLIASVNSHVDLGRREEAVKRGRAKEENHRARRRSGQRRTRNKRRC